MDRNFCPGCTFASAPQCAITQIPQNAYLEDILSNNPLTNADCFVCPSLAQSINAGLIEITSKCTECGICMLACNNVDNDRIEWANKNTEKAVFSDLTKLSLLYKFLLPETTVASEVQVKGNFRTKRIDLVIYSNNKALLIKALKTTDKAPLYMRSYQEVITEYESSYPGVEFTAVCLVPESKKNAGVMTTTAIELMSLYDIYTTMGRI